MVTKGMVTKADTLPPRLEHAWRPPEHHPHHITVVLVWKNTPYPGICWEPIWIRDVFCPQHRYPWDQHRYPWDPIAEHFSNSDFGAILKIRLGIACAWWRMRVRMRMRMRTPRLRFTIALTFLVISACVMDLATTSPPPPPPHTHTHTHTHTHHAQVKLAVLKRGLPYCLTHSEC